MSTNVHLKVKDHSVSGEEFDLVRHTELEMLATSPQPSEDALADYYNSEDYISHTDNKRNLLEWLYHVIRSYTVKRKVRLINSLQVQNKTLLDIGCGTGEFMAFANKKDWKVTGIEPNDRARAIAIEKIGDSVYNAPHLSAIEENTINAVTLWHVLEHLPDLQKQIDNFIKVLAPKGFLIVAVPNYKSYDAKYYGSYWAAYDVPRHLWHFTRSSIKTLFEKNGFSLVEERPMLFDAFYVSLLSEKYKHGKMNLLRAFSVGLISNIKAWSSGEYSSLIYVFRNDNT